MLNDLKNICDDRYSFLIRALENDNKDINVALEAIASCRDSFKYLQNSKPTNHYKITLCSEKKNICFHNNIDLRLYNVLTRKLIKTETFSDGSLEFAMVSDFLITITTDAMNFSTKDGIPLYSIHRPKDTVLLDEVPKIFSNKDYIVLSYKYKFYLIDPYFKSTTSVKKDFIKAVLGYVNEFNFVKLKNTLIVVNTSRKIAKNVVKTQSVGHIFNVTRANKISYESTTLFTDKVEKLDRVYPFFCDELDDFIVFQPSNGQMLKLFIAEEKYISCALMEFNKQFSIKDVPNDDTRYIATYSFNNLDIFLMASKDELLYYVSHKDKLKKYYSSKLDGINIESIVINDSICTISGKNVTVINTKTSKIAEIKLTGNIEDYYVTLKDIDGYIGVFACKKETSIIYLHSMIDITDRVETSDDEAI